MITSFVFGCVIGAGAMLLFVVVVQNHFDGRR